MFHPRVRTERQRRELTRRAAGPRARRASSGTPRSNPLGRRTGQRTRRQLDRRRQYARPDGDENPPKLHAQSQTISKARPNSNLHTPPPLVRTERQRRELTRRAAGPRAQRASRRRRRSNPLGDAIKRNARPCPYGRTRWLPAPTDNCQKTIRGLETAPTPPTRAKAPSGSTRACPAAVCASSRRP